MLSNETAFQNESILTRHTYTPLRTPKHTYDAQPVVMMIKPEMKYTVWHNMAAEDVMEVLKEVHAAATATATAAAATASGGDGDGGDGSRSGGGGSGGGVLQGHGGGGVLCGLFPPRLMLVAYTGGPAYALSMIKEFPSLYIGMSGAVTYAKVRKKHVIVIKCYFMYYVVSHEHYTYSNIGSLYLFKERPSTGACLRSSS